MSSSRQFAIMSLHGGQKYYHEVCANYLSHSAISSIVSGKGSMWHNGKEFTISLIMVTASATTILNYCTYCKHHILRGQNIKSLLPRSDTDHILFSLKYFHMKTITHLKMHESI